MMIAIPEDEWVVFHDLPAVELAEVLVSLARSVSLPKLRKHPRGPKKPKPRKQSGAKIKHVATAKILEARTKPKSPRDREFPMRDRLVTLGRPRRLG
jgi:hypothetical protein